MERPTQTSLEVMRDKGYKQEKQLNFSKNAIILKEWKEYANYLENEIQELKKGAVESKKVVIPQFVAEYIEEHKNVSNGLMNIIEILFDKDHRAHYYGATDNFYEWYDFNPIERFNTLVTAWSDRYEVEKENLYYVQFSSSAFLAKEFNIRQQIGIVEQLVKKYLTDDYKFTESEIKAIDERYWAFRVPVEE